ncbi:alpha/beta fold hydrolase [Microbispora sp. KK1-11]|uniref:alpha/beta fold hydrolase n=1 Tax=Microbispora sp. KK1-11 TaxID=2053005 RepID=UPI00115B5D49|nr:alpha/beta hydrolase [Microbispora sp. KK1-11]TQS29369.1 alpha/beta hydrolase [Microbispora sp. KK1-11]
MSPNIDTSSLRRGTAVSADGTVIGYQTLGTGPDLIVVGGNLRTSEDYLPPAAALAGSFTVHVVDRRGRGASGPQGPEYSLAKEVEDLRAVQAATGARLAFGHSYGGLVVLETARSFPLFDRIAVYEPGVPCSPIPTAWMAPFRERLAAGDHYGAFIHFIQGSGGAPDFMTKLPHWYLRMVFRIAFRGPAWQRMRSLLGACLAEHEQLAAQYGRLAEFKDVTAPVLLLVGGRSKPAHRAEFAMLRDTLPDATLDTIDGLGHLSPTEPKSGPIVAERALPFLLGR